VTGGGWPLAVSRKPSAVSPPRMTGRDSQPCQGSFTVSPELPVDTRAREARIRHVRVVRIPPGLDGSLLAYYVAGTMPNSIPSPGLP